MTTQLKTLLTWAKKSQTPPKFSAKGGRLKIKRKDRSGYLFDLRG
jgi:hypothetical protein